jgi:hypothetical protein
VQIVMPFDARSEVTALTVDSHWRLGRCAVRRDLLQMLAHIILGEDIPSAANVSECFCAGAVIKVATDAA